MSIKAGAHLNKKGGRSQVPRTCPCVYLVGDCTREVLEQKSDVITASSGGSG